VTVYRIVHVSGLWLVLEIIPCTAACVAHVAGTRAAARQWRSERGATHR
jgi:hypothetical protein